MELPVMRRPLLDMTAAMAHPDGILTFPSLIIPFHLSSAEK